MNIKLFNKILIIWLFFLPACIHKTNHTLNKYHSINDFSRLNKTTINRIITPHSYKELQDVVAYAKKNNLKISIAGSKHSQGGHAFYTNAFVVSLKKLNHIIDFNKNKKLITVQAGITWKQIQDYLHPHQLAIKTMQFANLFTIGGSLSVNCNGIDPHYGPLIESIHSIKILLADGSIVTANRKINPKLFSLAIGGYGLFGIILEATIKLIDDNLYKHETQLMPLSQYADQIENITHNPKIGFHFAFLTLRMSKKQLFGNVAVFNFKKLDSKQFSQKKNKHYRKLFQEKYVNMNKIVTRAWPQSKFIKALHWIYEGIKHGQIISRNNIMRPPASHLYIELPKSTNLLQEYFIPVDNLRLFINELEAITQQLDINLMHVALRFIPKNTESFLSYTTTNRIGIVLFFNQEMTDDGNKKTKKWTQHLINKATEFNGVYYLPIQLHANKNQLLKAYPQINDFFQFKKQYDPHELFINHFYKKYA